MSEPTGAMVEAAAKALASHFQYDDAFSGDNARRRWAGPYFADYWRHIARAMLVAALTKGNVPAPPQDELDRYRKALEFYAEKDNYDGWAPVECLVDDDGEDGGCEFDGGRIAREALSGRQTGGDLHGTMRGHG